MLVVSLFEPYCGEYSFAPVGLLMHLSIAGTNCATVFSYQDMLVHHGHCAENIYRIAAVYKLA